MNQTKERLQALRGQMEKAGLQAYIIPTSDFHDTEYVCDYYAARKYFSGFTGSAGTLCVLEDKAALWTDGRYFIQAARQLEGSGIELMKMGQPETPSLEQWLLDNLKKGDTVGFDGRTISTSEAEEMKKVLGEKGIALEPDADLVSAVWADRPALPASKTFHYEKQYTGREMDEKLADLRAAMKQKGAKSHVITKIDEVAWLYNLRADDIPSFPVALAYTTITEDGAKLYISSERLDEESAALLKENGVQIRPYNAIYEDIEALEAPVLLNPAFVNSAIGMKIPAEKRIQAQDPVIEMKACKNETELNNTRHAHIKDGAAVTKFMHWLKTNAGKEGMSELSAEKYLTERRQEQPLYLEDSFSPIVAYKDHAAMMHYSSSPETDVPLLAEGMLLVDSGGHYLDGTTDITRTFVLGPISEEEKFWFTKALQGHIRLQMAKFLEGCRGYNLDILCREPLWQADMDYQCGTGHGVGHLLSVHEPPNGFRWRVVPERDDSCVLREGMIQSDEPGVYMEGKFGIRHENELAVKKENKNFYGQFMGFENLTWVPFDRDGIDASLLNKDELAWLNQYHKDVYEKVSPLLDEAEAAWLAEATAPIEG